MVMIIEYGTSGDRQTTEGAAEWHGYVKRRNEGHMLRRMSVTRKETRQRYGKVELKGEDA